MSAVLRHLQDHVAVALACAAQDIGAYLQSHKASMASSPKTQQWGQRRLRRIEVHRFSSP
jgi:hypothetical protein